MDLGSILLALAVIIPVGVLVSRPFLQRNSSDIPTIEEENVKETSALLAQRERLLNMLQELEFDYTSGKIPSEDYAAQRNELLAQGAEILRQLDATFKPETTDLDARIEEMITTHREMRSANSMSVCPVCRKSVQSGDRFCSKCGTALH
jgi:DNA repair exonuclease SbcCD ATPase subunit